MAGTLIISQKEVKGCPYVTFFEHVVGTVETRNRILVYRLLGLQYRDEFGRVTLKSTFNEQHLAM
jgi:hypothetical protein